MKWIWAAYRKGGMKEWGFDLPEGLTPETFQHALARRLARCTHLWIMSANVPDKGVIPVGLAAGIDSGNRALEIQAAWFPWATPRNRYESTANFISRMRGVFILLFTSKKRWTDFYRSLCRLNLIRYVGNIEDLEPEPLALYQSKDIV